MKKYEDKEILEFKGVKWRFEVQRQEWHPVGKRQRQDYPSIKLFAGEWSALGGRGRTPLAALRAWARDEIKAAKRDLKETKDSIREYKAEQVQISKTINKLKATRWR